MSDPCQDDWRQNYFNYFTEVEERFQQARATSLFLLSPLDWALIETWKNSGIPLPAVLRGIDAAFDKWRARKVKTQMVNSLAFCAQAVLQEAESMANNVPAQSGSAAAEPAFPTENVRAHIEKALAALRGLAGYESISTPLAELLSALEAHVADLQELDQRLTALEDKMAALARTPVERRCPLRHAPRPRRAVAPLSRQDDHGPVGAPGKELPRPQGLRALRPAAPEPLFHGLKTHNAGAAVRTRSARAAEAASSRPAGGGTAGCDRR